MAGRRTKRTSPSTLEVIDLARMSYDDAFDLQREHHAQVLAWRDDPDNHPIGRLLLVEHDPPVVTVSRRPEARQHLVATPELLAQHGVELRETDRGGDITYHGPGQLIAYPIVDLNRLNMNLHAYMRTLEGIVINVCARLGVEGRRDPSATGVWVDKPGIPTGAKVCAMGVRVRRWVTMHGFALNVTTNLDHFDLIVPCGLAGRPVTSLSALLDDACPTIDDTKQAVIEEATRAFNPS
jgi:lipoyl(octanoyl) transferase